VLSLQYLGAIFAVESNGNWLAEWHALTGEYCEVLISFEIEVSISEADDSRQTIQ